MIRTTTSLPPPKKTRSPKREPDHAEASEVHRLIHEIVNHLSVMNLYCFRFREAATLRLPASLADIENMETATTQIAEMLNDLAKAKTTTPRNGAALDEGPSRPRSRRSRSSGNVYPLFGPLDQHRRD